jgi:pimeloyl-ACP methyl ester carboxylesterase
MSASVRSRFVMVNGVKTHYTESGGDTPVLIGLHGGGHGSSGAAGLGRLFELLADKYRVIGLDSVGGYGETDPYAPSPYGLQSRVDHLAAFVDTLCIDRFTIMGNSQGAWCAAKYAIMHPDRIDKIVLVSSGSISSAMGIKSQPSEGMKLLQSYDGTREAMERLLQGLVYNHDKITNELIDRRQKAATRPGAMESFASAGKQIRFLQNDPAMSLNYDMRHTLPALTKVIPTIFIWGENDIFAVPEIGRQLEKLLPDVKFHWIPKAGHQAQTDQPEIVAELIAGVPARVPAAV